MNEPLYIKHLFGRKGEMFGVLLSPELWIAVEPKIRPIIEAAIEASQPAPEPMEDWNYLKDNWDFDYPMPVDVNCSCCGASTDNWESDDPRKFKLAAASFGGIVTFKCLKCQAKVVKRHFKDKVQTETKPYQNHKTYSREPERS